MQQTLILLARDAVFTLKSFIFLDLFSELHLEKVLFLFQLFTHVVTSTEYVEIQTFQFIFLTALIQIDELFKAGALRFERLELLVDGI